MPASCGVGFFLFDCFGFFFLSGTMENLEKQRCNFLPCYHLECGGAVQISRGGRHRLWIAIIWNGTSGIAFCKGCSVGRCRSYYAMDHELNAKVTQG